VDSRLEPVAEVPQWLCSASRSPGRQWDEILRFLATIRLKVTSASQLFKRLNSYSKQHQLYRGLKEFGKGPKTLFILKYVGREPQVLRKLCGVLAGRRRVPAGD
jgi:TnpA family transposase